MKLKIICLFFTYLKSSKNIYDNLLDIVKQKIETKDYYLIDLEKKYYVFETHINVNGIVFWRCIRDASGSDNSSLKVDRAKYNTADEAIQAVCDYHLSSNLNISMKLPIFYKMNLRIFKHDIKLKLDNFFYNGVEPDFFARLYDSNKQKQIREFCAFFSRNRMIDPNFFFSSEKNSSEDTIQCFEEENKMKFFFPVKLRNLVLFFKIDVKDLYSVEDQYTSEFIKLHKNNSNNNICTEICTLITKIFTFSDYLLHSKLLNELNDYAKKKKFGKKSSCNIEKKTFSVLFLEKDIFFKNLGTLFCYSYDNPLEITGNCQHISKEAYQDCIEILKLFTKAKAFDFAQYKIIFYKCKNENLLNHLLYKICESPGSGSYIILMQILGYYKILNVSEIIFFTRSINKNNREQMIAFLKNFFTKEKLSKIHFMMTAVSEKVNNLLYTLIYKEAEEYFSIYKKSNIFNIEFFNDIRKFFDLYLCLNEITLYDFYSILVGNSLSIFASGEKTLSQLFESIALLTNLDVKYSIGENHVYFNKVKAKKMFQILNIDDPETLENCVESLIK